MKKLIFILFTLSIFKGNAQEAKFADKEFYLVDSLILEDLPEHNQKLIDSCLTLYHQTREDSIKWKSLNTIVENTYSEIWYEYQKLASEISSKNYYKKLSEKEHKTYTFFYAQDLNNRAYWLETKSKLNKAQKDYEKSLELQRVIGDSTFLTITLNNIATNLYKQGKISQSIEHFEECLYISKKIKADKLSFMMTSLAMIYYNSGENKRANILLNEALDGLTPKTPDTEKAFIYNNYALIQLKEHNNTEQAIKYLNKSLKIYQKLKFKIKISSTFNLLAQVHNKRNNKRKAIEYYHLSIKNSKEIEDYDGLSDSYNRLSNLYYKNDFDSSFQYAQIAHTYALASKNPLRIKNSALQLSELYKEEDEYKNSYKYLIQYHKMKDSISNSDTKATLAKTEAKLQYEKEKELAEIQHQNELIVKQKENEKQALYKQVFIFGSIILLIIILIILKQFSKSIKQKQTIEQSNIQLEEQHKEITSSITYAKRIQRAILPPNQTVKENFNNSFLIYKPKDIVSGDFYWLEKKEETIFFAVADCTGHGVPGAMVSVICNNGLNRSVREHQLEQSNEILDKTREIVIQEFEKSGEDIKDGMDISLIAWNKTTNTIQFSGAHNPLWIIRTQNNKPELIELKGDKQPIGNFERSFPFTLQSFQLQKGDTIYLASDGFADQFGGERNKKIKNVNFKKLLVQNFHLPMPEQQKILEQFFNEWKGDNEQLDDVCIAGIRF